MKVNETKKARGFRNRSTTAALRGCMSQPRGAPLRLGGTQPVVATLQQTEGGRQDHPPSSLASAVQTAEIRRTTHPDTAAAALFAMPC
eukprot:m.474945 g.474945  ORF g.474945 m.474945 type:complete len:88 (+) comp37211_c0_seq1:1-264(+)